MIKLLSKKLLELLFGNCQSVVGGTPLVADITYPYIENGEERYKHIKWDGNKGLIVTSFEKIEKLEKEIEKLTVSIALSDKTITELEDKVRKINRELHEPTGDKLLITSS